MDLLRLFMAHNCLCARSCRFLCYEENRGWLYEETKNSALHWSRIFEWPWAILNAELKSTDKVLDAGGSWGVFQYVAAERCKELVNLDLNEEFHWAIREMQSGFGVGLNIQPIRGDITKTPFADNTFDKVVCISVIEHMHNWQDGIKELFRILSPGGVLILTMDINHSDGLKSENFAIDMDKAVEFVERHGKALPSEMKPLWGQIDNGPLLTCLCLKFRK